MSKPYDVIVLGGGNIGLSCALALAQQGIARIALIESKAPQNVWQHDRDDLRVNALNSAVQKAFASLDVWSAMQAMRVSPYRAMQVWDSVGKAEIQFCAEDVQQSALGYIIENQVLQAALWQQLEAEEAIAVFAPASAARVSIDERQVNVTLHDKRRLQAKLIIGADGANSWLREQMAIDTRIAAYGHSALVTTVRTQLAHQQTARQCFMPSGPLALLPLLDSQHCSIVWSTAPDHAKALQQMSTDEFSTALMQAFGDSLGELVVVDQRVVFPLLRRHASEYVRSRVALIGDAAHTIHPLAGQGANLGLADAMGIAEIVGKAHAKGRDIGTLDTLHRYQRSRREAVNTMLMAMDVFKNLFASEYQTAVQLRNVALEAIHRLPLLKSRFMRHAMGL